MSSITPPADDVGVQSLRKTNRTARDIPSVSNVAAIPAIHRSPGATAIDDTPLEKRRRLERRCEERRKHKQEVLLDTRSPHDRRTVQRRQALNKKSEDKQSGRQDKPLPPRGVNVKV